MGLFKKNLNYQTYFYPGKKLATKELNQLVGELKEVASQCFDELPSYQALTGDREILKRVVLTAARDEAGKMLGFCSSIVLPVPDVGNVLHLGLTCVHPEARGLRLTHKLTSKLLLKYLLVEAPFEETWISNCACVLSSLGNVALYFEDLYPSPNGPVTPSYIHRRIAQKIDESYRADMAVNVGARLDLENFVFRGSVAGTTFEKDPADARFHHRNPKLTKFYSELLDFSKGDEALQVGKVSLFTFPKYMMKNLKKKSIQLAGFQDKLLHENS
jgi:hypothetical protein